MICKTPRLVIAGLSGDTGKTIISLSLLAALRRRGLKVAPFKKGPDYIDPAWLGFVGGNVCRNLDTYLVEANDVRRTFATHASTTDMAVVEGNRGLFDGKDRTGLNSTAGLAKLLQAPVVLIVNVTKMTRTVAALVKGCQAYDPELNVAGIILNKVAGHRHERVIRETVQETCGLPVLGAVPKLGSDASLLPGRHLGLVTPAEFPGRAELTGRLESLASNYLEMDKIIEIASDVPELAVDDSTGGEAAAAKVRVGYFDDSVFTFYYPENLESLRRLGAELIPVSSLADSSLPDLDALYIGGGFPETHASRLIENRSLMVSVKEAADRGLPIYAECGGLIYLCRSLKWKDATYPMAGVFPIDLAMSTRPIGHGYTHLRVDGNNPYFDTGDAIRGHEFHYSGVSTDWPRSLSVMAVETGVGLGNGRDGLLYKRTLACYTHVHADGVKGWAEGIISAAGRYAGGAGGAGNPSSFRKAAG